MLPNVTPPNERHRLKMYVLVNTNVLTPIQIGVQATHAVAELMNRKPFREAIKKWVEEDKTLIFLSATELERNKAMISMSNIGKVYSSFREPDIGDIWTATAFEPISSDLGQVIFGDLKLAR